MGDEITTRYHIQRREFLDENPIFSDLIIAIVQDTRDLPDEDEQAWKQGKVHLELADGYDWVFFKFDLSTCRERAKSLGKIKLLAEVINQFRDAIELEVESRDARAQVLCCDEALVA